MAELDEKDAIIATLKAQIETFQAQSKKLNVPYPTRGIIDYRSFFQGKAIRFGVVSDTHGGSKYAREEDLQTAYDIFEYEGITNVFHAGDLSDGSWTMHPGMIVEQEYSTCDAQIGHIIATYPKRKNIVTRFITGNHDHSWMKLAGIDIGLMVARDRSDMVYMGQIEQDCFLQDSIILRLRHPSDGGSYALSYKLQRYLDSLEGGSKPNILIQGHFHVSYEMEYRNVFALQVGAFQRQTLYLKAKGLQPSCSAYIVDVNTENGSIKRFKTEKYKFY